MVQRRRTDFRFKEHKYVLICEGKGEEGHPQTYNHTAGISPTQQNTQLADFQGGKRSIVYIHAIVVLAWSIVMQW